MTTSTLYPPPGAGDLALARVLATAVILLSVLTGSGQTPAVTGNTALTDLSIEQLLNTTVVTSVSKHSEKLLAAPAAVSVITADDIAQAGAVNLPEALRLAPGLDVARLDAHDWAISARGFNDLSSNKLLVLRDGRSVYTPLFGGVLWDAQDALMQDIERIEVVRGPGATLWGDNAVNGVINIITKPADETQGLMTSAIGGSDPEGSLALRYGGAVSATTHYRIYGKYTEYDDSKLASGADANDAWNTGLVGFRIDSTGGDGNLVTLQGEGYGANEHQIFVVPTAAPPSRPRWWTMAGWPGAIFSAVSPTPPALLNSRCRPMWIIPSARPPFLTRTAGRLILRRRTGLRWAGGRSSPLARATAAPLTTCTTPRMWP